MAPAAGLLGLILCGLFAIPASASQDGFVSASFIRRELQRGNTVDLTGVEVQGDLDLRGLAQVDRPFRCHSCRFSGTLLLTDVTFRRSLDLSGSRFARAVEARASRFEGPVVFARVAETPTKFEQGANFSSATFQDVASFAGAEFAESDFSSARFRSDARFDDAEFGGLVRFRETSFEGLATFASFGIREQPVPDQGTCALERPGFRQEAMFSGARFSGQVDFRFRCFDGVAEFSDADFKGRLDMRQAQFHEKAAFNDSRIFDGASWLGAVFACEAAFDGATAAGSLEFNDATFGSAVSFFGVRSSGVLVLADVTFGNDRSCAGDEATNVSFARKAGEVLMARASFNRLSMDLEHVHRVGREDERRVLVVIEEGARTDGAIDKANKARYKRHLLEAGQHGPVVRVLDLVAYRWMLGYFIRPLRPAIALGALITLVALIQHVRSPRPAGEGPRLWASGWADRVEDGVKLAFSKSARGKDEADVPLRRWGQYLAYKVLIVAIVIGIANSNQTLRQMLDAIR